jgi:hypothetical protein
MRARSNESNFMEVPLSKKLTVFKVDVARDEERRLNA